MRKLPWRKKQTEIPKTIKTRGPQKIMVQSMLLALMSLLVAENQ
jgi:hypothetical protein